MSRSLLLLAVTTCLLRLSAAASCTPGSASFVLVEASPAPRCLATSLAVRWPRIDVELKQDCQFTVTGKAAANLFRFPTSGAAAPFTDPSGAKAAFRPLYYSSAAATSADSLYADVDPNTPPYLAWAAPRDKLRPADLGGLGKVLDLLFDPASLGPDPPTTSWAANYTYTQAGPAAFRVGSPLDGCTYRFRLAAGTFPGFKAEACAAGSGADCPKSCPAGHGRVPLGKPASGSLCAPCPAGTSSPGGTDAKCAPCAAGAAAPRAGAERCEPCGGGLVPASPPAGPAAGPAGAACAPCWALSTPGRPRPFMGSFLPPVRPLDNGKFENTAFYGSGKGACLSAPCPKGSLADPLGYCISGDPTSGRLCAAAAAPGAPAPRAAERCAGGGGGGAKAGGAVLTLEGGVQGAAGEACKTGVAALAEYLKDKKTWAGFRSGQAPDPWKSGVFWQMIGANTTDRAPLASPGTCGNYHGTPPSKPTLTGTGTPLGTRAAAFSLFLYDRTPRSGDDYVPWNGYGALLAAGDAPGTLEATFFRDSGVDACGLTALSPKPPVGSCKLVFKVEAGSFLGASAPAKAACPPGTVAAAGGAACVACSPGSAASGGACKPCGGNTYSDVWGAAACTACAAPKSAYPPDQAERTACW